MSNYKAALASALAATPAAASSGTLTATFTVKPHIHTGQATRPHRLSYAPTSRLTGPDRGTGTGLDRTDFSAVRSQILGPDCSMVLRSGPDSTTIRSGLEIRDRTVVQSPKNFGTGLWDLDRTGPD